MSSLQRLLHRLLNHFDDFFDIGFGFSFNLRNLLIGCLFGLAIYNSSFIAEIVRAGIQGVPKGQREAALAGGLTHGQTLRLVVMPQALRIILPPLSNSYLNLTKESSLAVAVGYPELMRVANITLAETNQAIECIALIVLIYLCLSLITAALLNGYNRRVAATTW